MSIIIYRFSYNFLLEHATSCSTFGGRTRAFASFLRTRPSAQLGGEARGRSGRSESMSSSLRPRHAHEKQAALLLHVRFRAGARRAAKALRPRRRERPREIPDPSRRAASSASPRRRRAPCRCGGARRLPRQYRARRGSRSSYRGRRRRWQGAPSASEAPRMAIQRRSRRSGFSFAEPRREQLHGADIFPRARRVAQRFGALQAALHRRRRGAGRLRQAPS